MILDVLLKCIESIKSVQMNYTQLELRERVPWYVEAMWWFIFFVAMIVLQYYFSGVDLLVIGVLVALQDRKISIGCCLVILFSFFAEATDTLLFGGAFLWYASVIAGYYGMANLLSAHSMLFMLLFSLYTTLMHFLFILIFASLEHSIIDWNIVLPNTVKQFVIMFPIWYSVYRLRIRFFSNR